MAYCDVYITSLSFATADPEVMNRFADAGLSVNRNPLSRRMTGQEIAEMAGQARAIIAGTDDLGSVARDSEHLRQIVRLGVGLDGVPLEICAEKGIAVVNTPDAVTDSVAEFTLSLILAVERRVFQSDRRMALGIENWGDHCLNAPSVSSALGASELQWLSFFVGWESGIFSLRIRLIEDTFLTIPRFTG